MNKVDTISQMYWEESKVCFSVLMSIFNPNIYPDLLITGDSFDEQFKRDFTRGTVTRVADSLASIKCDCTGTHIHWCRPRFDIDGISTPWTLRHE
jgi:hypothetical protein